MNGRKKSRWILEIILFAVVALIVIYIARHHAPRIVQLLDTGNIQGIDTYLQEHGTDGRVLLVLLQIIETLSVVLPALPVYICAGMLFGKLYGILVCFTVNLVLNLLMFLFGRRMTGWVRKHFDIRNNPTVQHWIESAKHMDRIVLVLCLIPVVPNGTIPYLAAQTEITVPQFIRAIAAGSLLSIVIDVCFGDILLSDGWRIVLPIILLLMAAGILFMVFRKRAMQFLKPRLKKFIEG